MAYSTNEPVPVTHGVMRPSRKSLLPFALLAGALWTGGTGLYAQTPVNLTVSATTPPPYVADQTITTDTGNPLIVNSGVSVTFQAGSQIVLAPGFHAMAGSTFTALIAFPTLTIVSPSSLPAATAGVAYAGASVVASGGSGVYTWSASGLPTGMSIGVYTGIVAGTPTSNSGGSFTVQVTVQDSNSATVSRNYTLVVSPPLSITAPSSLPEGTVGAAFPSTTAIATGGSGTYTWSQTGLPAGLSIGSASGAITGTPTASTASPVTVQLTATDSNGVAASRNFTFAVNPAMSITGPTSLPSGTVNSAYSSTTVTASGGTGNYTWSATGLPPGLSIVSGGVIQGTPNTSAGSPYSVQVTASDSNMATASSTFNLAVSSGQDFGLTLNYSYAPVSFTSSISIPIPTTCVNGFSGNISFNGFNFTSGYGELPAYYPPGMSSVTVPCGSSGTMTLNMYSNNPPGPPHTYQVTVQAQATIDGQTVVHSQTYGVNLTADPASGMVATPYAQTVVAGGPPAFFSVGFPTANAFGGTVALSCSTSSQLPCSEVGLSPASLYNPLGLTSTMTVTVPAGTAPGVYSISVLGTVSGQQQQVSTSVQVTVAGPVDSGFTLSASPVWQQVAAGGSATYAITANPNNGFTGDITLSCVGLPPGVTAGVSPNPITASAGYSGMLTLSVDPSVASGTATCTLIGTSGSVASQVLANAQIVNSPAQSEGITITTSPAGLSLIIDASTTQPGTPCTSPCVFQWVASSTHNISAPSTQGTGGTQYVFSSWSDSQPQTHQIIASSSATYTASFITQYYLSMTATNGGAVTPSSGYYNSGQTVTVTAPSTASNGAIFTGFSGAISGMSLQQTMVLAGPEGVVANFTAVPSSVPITALPASETVAPGGTTTFSVVVNNAAGLGGAANLAISGVPQGSTASFSPASLGGPGTSTLSVAVASNTALGTYPLTITASNGTSTATTMATLTVTSPVPANMISPASGSSLSAGPVTFAWDSGLGVSQYQFVLGTQPGKSDLYNGAAGTSQSASFTLEASGPSAYGQLSSMVAGVWQPPIQYSYKLNQTSPQSVTASGIGYSNNADWVDAGGPASQPWTYCVVPAGSSCSNTTLSAAYISNCQVDAFVSAKILAEGYASSTEQPNAFDVTFTASASAPPGPRSLSCLYSPPSSAGLTLKLKNALTVDSAPPYIASIIQETQAYPGAPFYVYLYGKHFGSQPGWVKRVSSRRRDLHTTVPSHYRPYGDSTLSGLER